MSASVCSASRAKEPLTKRKAVRTRAATEISVARRGDGRDYPDGVGATRDRVRPHAGEQHGHERDRGHRQPPHPISLHAEPPAEPGSLDVEVRAEDQQEGEVEPALRSRCASLRERDHQRDEAHPVERVVGEQAVPWMYEYGGDLRSREVEGAKALRREHGG